MGLDIYPGGFSCGYGGFFAFRQSVCERTGGVYDMDGWRLGPGYTFEDNPGLCALMAHSDCDGTIEPQVCKQVADELEALYEDGTPGHKLLWPFIKACRLAVKTNETMEFR